jgi:hypothetical protein
MDGDAGIDAEWFDVGLTVAAVICPSVAKTGFPGGWL